MKNTFKIYTKRPEIFRDSVKRISGEITIKLDSGYSIKKDVSYNLTPRDAGFEDFSFNEATSEVTLSENQMQEFYAAEYAYITYPKLVLPKLEGASEKQVSYAQSVRSENIHGLLESYFEDKAYFEAEGYSEADYIKALNSIISARVWLDLLDRAMTHRGRNSHLLENA